MEEILHHLGCIKTLLNNGINYHFLNWCVHRISEPSTVSLQQIPKQKRFSAAKSALREVSYIVWMFPALVFCCWHLGKAMELMDGAIW